MCWTLNHQNILEMAQGHISLSNVKYNIVRHQCQYTICSRASLHVQMKRENHTVVEDG
jgi:hypothetical protein